MTTDEQAEFCPDGVITEIECRDSVTRDDYWTLQEATCTVADGLVCDNMIAIGIDCRNYEIRYKCQCSGIELCSHCFENCFRIDD